MMKNKKRIIIIICCLIIAFVVVRSCGKIRQKQKPTQVQEIITPFYGTIENTVETLGIVGPQNRLEVIPPISGRVEEILVSEGDLVKRGEILAWMSSTERAALLDTARSKGEEALEYWEDVYKPTPLMAPIDGEVIVRGVEPGQTVGTASPVIVISDRLIVIAWVDESDIGMVKVGQKAHITLDAYPDKTVIGQVDHISFDAKTYNNVTIYEVTIIPDQIPEFFRSGMSADIRIVVQKKEDILLIPEEAVQKRDGKNFVMGVNPQNNAKGFKQVTLGLSDEKNVEVTSGLAESDQIVVTRQYYHRPERSNRGRNPFAPAPKKSKK